MISPYPLVSIICTVYNQEKFVRQALGSVVSQTYENLEIIVIDNASTDNSRLEIEKFVTQNPSISFIKNKENVGLCRAFNEGVKVSKGKYLIDLSGDDVLLPHRIAEQVEAFEQLSDDYAVVFSNALLVDNEGNRSGFFYKPDDHVPTENVYEAILKSYAICTPTIMIRRRAFETLGGYDESLAFEDFDFFVRSARKHKYFYIDKILTQKRILKNSMSAGFYQKNEALLASCLVVCQKALALNQNQAENEALAVRIEYFIKKCFVNDNPILAAQFKELLLKIKKPALLTKMFLILGKIGLPMNKMYRFWSNS